MNETLTKTGIIAIVDDDEPLREALGSVMKAAGFSPRLFASAEEFLAYCDNCDETACLILDVRLPGISGIELQRRLADAKNRADLGQAFGPALTAAEVRYLMAREWARFPDDILWRRSKLGLTMLPAERDALAAFMATAR